MHSVYVVTGTLTDDHTVTLDEELPLTPTKVRVVIEPLTANVLPPYSQVIEAIRARQQERGHQPPTKDEVDIYLQHERGLG
ncbi:MAG: hypothetical protein JO316_06000 [Abitibacteriaceae bacterium]|nr:hypothetical protein [Abditibacteriaceae bacterium]